MASIHKDYSPTGKFRGWKVAYKKPNGKNTTERGFKTKRDAEAFKARIEVNIADGEYIDPSRAKITIAELAPTYLEGKRTNKPSYIETIESAWRVHVQPQWGNRQIGSIRYSEIQAWVSNMSEERSRSTVHKAYDVLKQICDLAVRDGIIKRNPCEGVQFPKKEQKTRTSLTLNQLLALADAAGDHRAVVLVAGFCGLRFGELRALRVKDVDVQHCRLNVNNNAVRVTGKIIEGTPKTHRVRSVPVPKYVMNVLIEEIKGRSPDELLFKGKSKGGYIGEVRPSSNSRNWYARAIKKAGVPEVTMHELRHTAASIAISSSANVKVIQKMLGHKMASMTLDIYADLYDSDAYTVANTIDEQINRLNNDVTKE